MFKWIYEMGVQNERNRIKRLIAEFSLVTQAELNIFEEDRPSKPARRRMEERLAAQRILDELIKPRFIGSQSYGDAPIDET